MTVSPTSRRILSAKKASLREIGFGEIAAMAGGHAEARAIQVALKLGLFEALKSDALDEASLARRIDADPRATGLLANAISALSLLEKNDGRFSLSDASRRYLIQDSGEYLGGMILFDAALWDEWGRLEDSVRRGKPARAPDMFQSTPAETARFIRAMDSLVRRGLASRSGSSLKDRPVIRAPQQHPETTTAGHGSGMLSTVAATRCRWSAYSPLARLPSSSYMCRAR